MKKIISIIALTVLGINLQAAVISSNFTANINQVVPAPARINKITATSTSTNIAVLTFYDAPYTNLTFVTAAYSYVLISAPGTYVDTYTNVFGTVEHWTNTVVRSTLTTNAAATNTYPVMFQMVIPTNTTSSFTPTTRLFTGYGLTVTNNMPANIFVDYSQ